MAIDQPLKRKRGRPEGGGSPSANKSQRDKMVMEQKMALVHRRLALLDSESDKDADVLPTATMDDKLAAVVDQQSVIINWNDIDDEDEDVPLRIVRPQRVDSEQKKLPDVSQTHNAQDTDTAEKKRRRLVNANAKSNMEQKLKLSTPRLAICSPRQSSPRRHFCPKQPEHQDSTSAEAEAEAMAIDQSLKRKRGKQAGGGSPSANKSLRDKMVMERKMALVHRRLALLYSESDKDADVVPMATMDDKIAAVVDQQPVIIQCDDMDDEDEHVPLRILWPRMVDSEQKKLPDVSQTHNAQDTDTAEKKRRRLVNANAKSNMEQKLKLSTPRLALFESGGSNNTKSDIDDDLVPMILWPRMVDSEQKKLPDVSQTHNAQDTDTAEKKRRRLVNANAKCNMEQKLKLSTPRLALFKSGGSNNTKSDIDDDLVPMIAAVNCQKTCASIQGNFWSAMERAEEVLVKLPAEHPSFVKHMLHSHVVQGFWLGLPSNFCNKHLPKTDTTIVLEDEDGHIYDAKYLGAKQGLSAGWRGFAINHDIKVGDVVVFQLVSSAKFKVYILRANKFTITDGALGLLCLDAGKEKMLKVRSNDVKPKENRKVQSDSSNPVSDSIIDGIRFSDTAIDFDHVKNFSNFNIIVDGLVIDCKFPDHLRRTYYELCCAQESFLHKDLLKQINLALAVGVIMETINIAEGIRAARASSHQDFLVWKKTLEAFQLLGMNVEFLLKRIDDLLGLPARPRDPAGHEEKKEMKLEHARAEAKMKELESRMSSVKNTLKKMDVEMEEMESSAKRMEMWLATAAPW